MAFIGCARNPHRSAPARLRNTDPEDLFLALTSFLPGDSASEEDLSALRAEIAKALEAEGGVLNMERQLGLFISVKNS